jgi:hypothetical protein
MRWCGGGAIAPDEPHRRAPTRTGVVTKAPSICVIPSLYNQIRVSNPSKVKRDNRLAKENVVTMVGASNCEHELVLVGEVRLVNAEDGSDVGLCSMANVIREQRNPNTYS